MPIHPGQIYRRCRPGLEPRPYVVVSRENLNRGDYVVGVPLTSQRLDERWDRQNCVFLQHDTPGAVVEKDCVVQAEAITVIHKSELDFRGEPQSLDTDIMEKVVRAIGHVISADCEPDS